jgi:hypothetical protein
MREYCRLEAVMRVFGQAFTLFACGTILHVHFRFSGATAGQYCRALAAALLAVVLVAPSAQALSTTPDGNIVDSTGKVLTLHGTSAFG